MAGDYGEINSRVDFHRVLGEALDAVRNILAGTPDFEVMQRIAQELEAMEEWSKDGRTPSDEERGSIDIGLVAVRELDGAPFPVGDLTERLSELNNYFEDWPTDEEAAGSGEVE